MTKSKVKRKINLKIKETLDDGNCFFSSIFRALQEKDLLNKFYDCFPKLKSNSEESFMKKLRAFIAENSVESISEMFTNFSELDLDEETFLEISENVGDISEVLASFFNKNKFQSKYKDQFIKAIQKSIKTDQNWVGELEVLSFQNIINNDCGIKLKTFNSHKNVISDIRNDNKNKRYRNTIYLLNIDCAHWVYI